MAIVVGALVAAWEVSRDFSRSTGEIVSTAEQLLELTLDAAQETVYQLDVAQAENLISGLMQHELFVQAALIDELGQVLAVSQRTPQEFSGVMGFLDIPMTEFEYDLPLSEAGDVSGKLIATLDVKAGLTPFVELSIAVAIGLMFEALVVAILIFLVVVVTVTNPIGNLARRLTNIEPGSGERLDLDKYHGRDEIGHLIGSANRYLDTASRYQSELEQSKQILQDTLNSLLEGVITADEQGAIISINSAGQQMFGYSADQAIGLDLQRLFEKKPASHSRDGINSAIAGKNAGLRATGIKASGESFPVELATSEIRYPEGTYRLWTIRDVSEHVQLERERLKLEDKLRHSQKMEAMGTLAGGIAHDFNNILGGVAGFTELAILESEKDSSIQGHLSNVLAGTEKAAQLVKRILAFSRKQAEEKADINLVHTVNECLALIKQTIPSTIKLEAEFDADKFIVYASESMMLQVLMNLYTNAASAIGDAPGSIHLKMELTDSANEAMLNIFDQVSGRLHIDRQYLRISIQDSGPGIPAEILHRIFEPYFTTKELGAGTGMGLAMVHSIVEAHDGFVQAENCATGGALFSIFLPLATSQSEMAEDFIEDVQNNSDCPVGKERILVVDDNEMLTELFSKALSRFGYEVVVSNNGDHALSEFSKSDSHFDLVISDQTMPGMNGDKLFSKIHALKPSQRTILCTGFSNSISREQAEAQGIKRYLQKPVAVSSMCQVVREVLDEPV